MLCVYQSDADREESARLIYNYNIVPWNAPIVLALGAAAFPIMCGNTVALKASEASPRVQAIVVETLAEVSNRV